MAWSSTHLDYPEDQHQARLVCGDPKACAWEWIRSYAENLSSSDDPDDYRHEYGNNVTADELIETGLEALGQNYAYLSKGPLFDGVSLDPTFWDKLAILKDLDIPHEKRNNFFSCSC
jgi:hypothetical protein